jgi:hypothetical protein
MRFRSVFAQIWTHQADLHQISHASWIGMTAAQVGDGHPAMARCNTIAAARAASPGLTMRQCGSAFCSDPEHKTRRHCHLHHFKTTARIAPPR